MMQSSKESGQFKKLKWTLRNRGPGYPSKRWGHTTVVYEKSLHIYGGNHSGNPKEGIYKIDCQTLEGSSNLYEHMPPVRESHSCNLIKDNLYIYGGCINQQVSFFNCTQQKWLTNDLLLFRLSEGNLYWKKIEQKNPIPPRQSHVSLALTNKHILIYGGTNSKQQVLDDFWLIDLQTGIWQQITDVKGVLQPKIGCTIIMIQSTIYMFGGQFGQGEQSQYSNNIYTLQFQNTNYSASPPPSLTISQLQVVGTRPSPRTGHCCIDYKGKFMLIIGGQGMTNKNSPVLYNDIWLFDLKTHLWSELAVENRSNFKPRSNFSANLHKNTIYIFGGFINLASFKSTEQFVTLTLYQNKNSASNILPSNLQSQNKFQKTSQYCLTCKFQFVNYTNPPIQTKIDYKPINNSLYCNYSNVERTALTISSSFQSLSLLLNTIGCLPGIQRKQVYLDLISIDVNRNGNGLNVFSQRPSIFQQKLMVLSANGIQISKKQLQLLIYLYNFDSQDLGFDLKTSILRLGRQFLLSYIFIDEMMHLYYFQNHNIYHFTFHKNALAYEIRQKVQYKVLLQFISHYNIDIQYLCNQSFCLFIGSLQKDHENLQIVQKQMRFDLQSMVKNNKVVFSQYIKQYFYEKVPLVLYLRGQKIELRAYSKIVRKGKNIAPITNSFEKICLQLDQDPFITNHSPFIKVYYANRRVGNFNKYPFISGYLVLKDSSSLNFARTRCQSWQVRENLQKQVKNALQISKKRQASGILQPRQLSYESIQ